MIIKKATLNDVKTISKIISVLNTKNYHPSDIKQIKYYISRGWYYVALYNSKIVGAMALEPTEGSYHIYSIASKKNGVGRVLIDYAIKKCIKEKIPKLWCWSLKRYDCKGFWEKMNFEESFLLKKQWHGEDCYLFGKVIK